VTFGIAELVQFVMDVVIGIVLFVSLA